MSACRDRADAAAVPKLAGRLRLILLLLMLVNWAAWGQTPAEGTVYLRVQVRELGGEPMAGLRAVNFHVEAGGKRLAVTVTPPAGNVAKGAGTRVLLLMTPEFARQAGDVRSVLEKLPERFRGAEVSVLRTDGSASEAAGTRAALLSDYGATAGAKRQGWAQAIAALGHYRGRRALMVVTGRAARTPAGVRAAAAEVGALVYQVGGDTAENYEFSGTATSSALPAYGQGLYGASLPAGPEMTVVNDTVIWESNAREAVRDVRVERSVRGALRDIARDGAGFYELSVPAPQGTGTMSVGLESKRGYQITAEAYREGGGQVPELVVGR